MKWVLIIVSILFSAASAHADFFYKLVGYECDSKANTVILTYSGALNDAGRQMIKSKGSHQWDPWKLIIKDRKNKNHIGTMKTVSGQCRLNDGTYEITIGPLPGNGNLQGKCGGFMTAWAEVRRGTETILPRHDFEFGDCHVAQPVTTKILIQAGGKEPIITKVSWDEFYKINRPSP